MCYSIMEQYANCCFSILVAFKQCLGKLVPFGFYIQYL
uniref:Uncharacterized protein n=1 Tax=Arundo donax TaxID=35708 RepID=A0A0A9FTE0_ARUDO